jgi:hypothetical protein
VISDTETLPDGLGGKPLDKKGVQSGEAAVQGLRGLKEEAAAEEIVHDGLRGEGEFWVASRAGGKEEVEAVPATIPRRRAGRCGNSRQGALSGRGSREGTGSWVGSGERPGRRKCTLKEPEAGPQ